jgi:multiple sugar transport system substrate-binding protein
VRFLVGLDLIMPLDDMIAQDTTGELQAYLDDMAPAMTDSMRVDGQLYFFPYSWNDMVVYYNKQLFDAAGIEYPKDDWTRDEFLAAAQAIAADTDGDGNIDRYGWGGSGGGIFFSVPWVLANGTNIVTDDFCAPNLTDPGVVDAIQFIYDMIYTYKVAPIPGTLTSTPTQFANGEIGMFGGGHWGVPQMYALDYTDYDVVPWPGNPDQTTIYGVDGFGMFRSAENPAAAGEFLKYMTSEAVQDVLVGGAEEGPLFNIPARRSVAEKMLQFPPDNQGVFYGALDGNVALVPSPPRFNELGSIYDRYFSAIMADEMPVEEALAAAQNELLSVVTC